MPCRSIWIRQECYKVVYCGGGKTLLNCLEDCLKLTVMREAVKLLCPLFWWYKQPTWPSSGTGCRKSKSMGIIEGEFQRKIIFCNAFLEWGKKIRYDFFEGKLIKWRRQEKALEVAVCFAHWGPVWAKGALQVRGCGATRRGELRLSICEWNRLLSVSVFITWYLTSVYNSCFL